MRRLTLILSTVFGPLQTLQVLLEMTNLNIRQWLVCAGVALSIVVVAEIGKAIRKRTAARVRTARADLPNLTAARADTAPTRRGFRGGRRW